MTQKELISVQKKQSLKIDLWEKNRPLKVQTYTIEQNDAVEEGTTEKPKRGSKLTEEFNKYS